MIKLGNVCLFWFLPAANGSSVCSTFLTIFGIVCLVHPSHSAEYLSCCFVLLWLMVVRTFHVLIDHLHIFFRGMSKISFARFKSVLSLCSSLYTVDTRPLSDIWPTNVFCHSVGCLCRSPLYLWRPFCGIARPYMQLSLLIDSFSFALVLGWGCCTRS